MDSRRVRFRNPDAGARGATVFGVSLSCETDGAVAPLRGMFPTVMFSGEAAEVSVQHGPPEAWLVAEDAEEGADLVFRLVLESPAVADFVLDYYVEAVSDHVTGAAVCAASPGADIELPLALSNVDVQGSMTVRPGDTEAEVVVPTCEDSVHEADETVRMTLGPAPPIDPSAPDGLKVLRVIGGAADAVISDDDPAPDVVVTAAEVREGSGSPLRFEVSIGAVGRDVDFGYETRRDANDALSASPVGAGGACPSPNPAPLDYIAATGSISFGPFGSEQVEMIDVDICDDLVGEPDETVELFWDIAQQGFVDGSVRGTIGDDEPEVVVATDCPGTDAARAHACASEDAGEVVFAIERKVDPAISPGFPEVVVNYVTVPNPPDGAVTHDAWAGGTGGVDVLDPCSDPPNAVLAARSDGSHYDYVPQSGTVRFPASNDRDARQTVSVTINDDALDEHDETFRLHLCRATDNAYVSGPVGQAVIYDDDDTPEISVADEAVVEPVGDGGITQLSFTATLSAVSGRDVLVQYWTDAAGHYPPEPVPGDVAGLSATPHDDYAPVDKEPPGRFGFTAESDNLQRQVIVEVFHDDIDEGADTEAAAETLALRLSASNALFADASGSCAAGLPGNNCALGKIIDNDLPHLALIDGCEGADQQGLPAADACAPEDGSRVQFSVALVDADGNQFDAGGDPYTTNLDITVKYRTVAQTGAGAADAGADYLTVDARHPHRRAAHCHHPRGPVQRDLHRRHR